MRDLDDGSALFALHFESLGAPGSTTSIEIVSTPTPFKVVPASGEEVEEVTAPGNISVLDQVSVSGLVTLMGDGQTPIPGATISVEVDGNAYQSVTDTQGFYVLTVTPGSQIKIHAALATDSRPNYAVDVADIIELRKHILNRKSLESSMTWLAADPTRDDSIDVADIVAMRKVILNRTDHFSKNATGLAEDLFRFVNISFKDVTATQSFSELTEATVIGFSGTAGNLENVDFAGVKLGDANGDWEPPASGSTLADLPSGARVGQPVADASLGFGALQRANDGSLTLPVYAMANEPLLGVQFELNWNGAVMALDRISSTRLPGFSPEFHASIEAGTAKVAWDDAVLQGVTLDGTEPLLTLHFSRLSEGATGLELEAPVLAGEQGSLGWVQPVSVYLKPDNTSQLAYGGAIKAIEVQGSELRLLVDTQAGQSYQLQATAQLEQPAWQALMELEGSDTWQEVVLPADSARAYLRLVPVDGAVR